MGTTRMFGGLIHVHKEKVGNDTFYTISGDNVKAVHDFCERSQLAPTAITENTFLLDSSRMQTNTGPTATFRTFIDQAAAQPFRA